MIDWEPIEAAPRDGMPLCSGFLHRCPNRLSGTGIGMSFAGLLRTAIWRSAMNISHRTGRLSRRLLASRSCCCSRLRSIRWRQTDRRQNYAIRAGGPLLV
jgi:hypothetical protein